MPDGSESWTVLGDDGAPVPAVEGFLAHLHALDRAPTKQLARQFGDQRAAASTSPG